MRYKRNAFARLTCLASLGFGLFVGSGGIAGAQPTPRLGIQIRNCVVVQSILKGSTAERMGLQKSDIIFKANGVPIGAATDLSSFLARRTSDKPLSLLIHRDSQLKVVSAEPSQPAPETLQDSPRPSVRLGVSLENGVLVENIQKGSAAERMGVQKFDLIAYVGDYHIAKADELPDIISKYRSDQPLSLQVYHDGEPTMLSIKSLRPDPNIPEGPPLTSPSISPIIGPVGEFNPQAPPPDQFMKKQLAKLVENSPKVTLPYAEQVSATINSISVGKMVVDPIFTLNWKAPFYYPIKVQATISETYAGHVEYSYDYEGSYFAILKDSRWSIYVS